MEFLDRTKPPVFYPLEDFQLKEVVSEKFGSNYLHVLNAGTQDVVHIEVIFSAGNWFQDIPGQAFFTAKMLKEGCEGLNSKQLSTFFDQFGAFLEINTGMDRLTIGLHCLNRYLPEVLPVFKQMIFSIYIFTK